MSLQSSPSPPSGSLPGAQGGAATSSRSDPTWRGVRDTATSTLGLVLIVALGLKLVVGVLGSVVPGWLRVLDVGGSIVLVVALGYLLVRILALLQRRLLWRVRRRLVLSYVLIGFVPIVLIVSFFLLAGVLMLGTESSSRVQLSFEDVVDAAAGLAATTAVDLRGLADPDPDAVSAVLERRIREVEERYPSASIVVVPRAEGDPSPVAAGPWRHTAEPPAFPAWLAQESHGIVMTGNSGRRDVVARAAEVIDVGGGAVAVVADLPLGDDVVAPMQAFTRIT